jgi:very-short-patch-repair endonuclease
VKVPSRYKIPKAPSEGEETFMRDCRALAYGPPARQYIFHPGRKWAFDFAFPGRLLAVEIEGGTWSHGRHTRGVGFAADCAKYNAAALDGWRVLRYTTEMVKAGAAIAQVEEALR